jgi:adenylosuccinate lyase
MEQGLTRTQAYELVQRAAHGAWSDGRDFVQVLETDPQIRKHLSLEAVRRCVDPQRHLRHVDHIFRRVGLG